MTESVEAVGLAVRHLRQRRGWSQEELCWQADVQRAYLSALERFQVAEGLEVPRWRVLRLADNIEAERWSSTGPNPRAGTASAGASFPLGDEPDDKPRCRLSPENNDIDLLPWRW